PCTRGTRSHAPTTAHQQQIAPAISAKQPAAESRTLTAALAARRPIHNLISRPCCTIEASGCGARSASIRFEASFPRGQRFSALAHTTADIETRRNLAPR
ncbi:MAG: hypothetical protein ACR2NB_04630, partial [Solirubrobacteraceae bacterium]